MEKMKRHLPFTVIPGLTRNLYRYFWFPAFAGMTRGVAGVLRVVKGSYLALFWLLLKIPGYKKLSVYLQKATACVLTMFILLSSISSIFLYSPLFRKSVSAVWYDDNWAYRKRINTTVASNSSDISNLQMLLTVDTSTGANGIGSGKMQGSCQDLRFTNTSGKLLPYYIDSGCTTTTTKIWVMVDLVPKNTTSMTIYMYYGNPSASTGSNSQPYFDNVVGLVGYWNMNESSWNGTSGEVKDMSVNGNNGTAAGNATTTSSGQYSNAGTFNGTGDYVSVADSGTLFEPAAITVEGWAKLASGATNNYYAIVNNQGTGDCNYKGYTLQFQNSTSSLIFGIIGNDGQGHTAQYTNGSSYAGSWIHVTGTFDGSNVKLYINGVLLATTPYSGFMLTNIGNFYIGIKSTCPFGASAFNGNLDDVKIYNTARSATQILNDYNNRLPNGQTLTIATTAPTTVIPTTSIPTDANAEKAPSPLAYWKFDDGQGTAAQDSTTNNADGTLAGTTVPAWKTEDLCVSGKCLYFDGLTSKVTVAKVLPSVQTVNMWVRPNTIASIALADFDGGTHTLTTNSSGVVTANGFTSPTYYLNGLSTTTPTLVANRWNHLEVTTGTSFASTSSQTLGLSGSTYFKGFIDEVKIYPYARSSNQILADFNSRSSNEGISADTAGGVIASGAKQSSLSDGLVGYWKMDESSWTNDCSTTSVTDSSGNGNNGKSCPNAGGTQPTNGKYGNGGSFDGTDDYVGISNTVNVPRVTISVWVYMTSYPSSKKLVTGFMDGLANGVYDKDIYITASGYPFFYVYDGGGRTTSSGTSPLALNQWNHLVGTADGTNAYMFVNGVLVGSVAAGSTYSGYTVPNFFISGNIPNQSWDYFSGSIDEVRLYNRALSPAEVSALYNFAPGPKVYLKMDEGTGTSANDSSGNSNNGTVNSGTWTTGKYGKGVKVNGTTGSDVSVPDFGY